MTELIIAAVMLATIAAAIIIAVKYGGSIKDAEHYEDENEVRNRARAIRAKLERLRNSRKG